MSSKIYKRELDETVTLQEQRQSNAERIQNLSVEELAKFLNSFSCNCLGGGVKGKCSSECKIKPREKDCCTEKDILTWLRERSKR